MNWLETKRLAIDCPSYCELLNLLAVYKPESLEALRDLDRIRWALLNKSEI
jgi:hypothetical protein